MRISNELRIVLLAFVSISVLIWGFYYLKGKNLFSKTINIYATYDTVKGLQKAGPIKVNGFKVGTIGDIYLREDFSGKIIVRFDLDKKLELPKKGTYAVVTGDVMGNSSVALKFKKKCTGGNCLETGDTIIGVNFGALGDFTGDIDPYMKWAESSFEALDSMLTVYTYDEDNETYKALVDLRDNLIDLNKNSGEIDADFDKKYRVKIDKVLKEAKSKTKGYRDDSQKIVTTMENASKSIKGVKDMNLQKTVKSTNEGIEQAVKKTRDITKVIKKLADDTQKIKDGEGKLGALINETKTIDDINTEVTNFKNKADSIRIGGF